MRSELRTDAILGVKPYRLFRFCRWSKQETKPCLGIPSRNNPVTMRRRIVRTPGFLSPALGRLLRGQLLMSNRNSRQGLWLFTLYLIFYGAFVLTSAFFPDVMESTPFGGLNLAITWGFALIIFAILLSLLYGVLCRETTKPDSSQPSRHP